MAIQWKEFASSGRPVAQVVDTVTIRTVKGTDWTHYDVVVNGVVECLCAELTNAYNYALGVVKGLELAGRQVHFS